MNAVAKDGLEGAQAEREELAQREESGARSLKVNEGFTCGDTLQSKDTGLAQVRFGRYDLIERVGKGGMGEVFRAYDRELMEEVALKILRNAFVERADTLAMFRREVRLARRISHRNVARTYEFGTVDSTPYLTMEFIRGERLDDRLRRFGKLSEQEALSFGTELCLGLEAAHAVGVIHRDIKPDNVLLAHDGRLVITDFGVARQLGDEVTHSGGLAGTPTYMAPEQVTGDPITPATDVFAVGVVLFELLTGRAPWVAEGAYATALARLFKPAPDPRSIVPTLSSPVADLLVRCLTQGQRLSSATELRAAIAAIGSPSAPPRPVSGPIENPPPSARRGNGVVVLPFSTRSDDERVIAEGLAEDLAGELSSVRELRVLSAGLASRRTWSDPTAAGTELGADLVVEGNLRRTGDVIRINARLLRVSDGSSVWSQRIDCAPQSVLSIQGQLARQISGALQLHLPSEPPSRAPMPNEATQLYNESRAAYFSNEAKQVAKAQRLIERAQTLCPNDTLLLATGALVTARRWLLMRHPEQRLLEQASRQAHQAIGQDDTLGEAHLALGGVEFARGHSVEAIRALRTALERKPGLGEAHELFGLLLLEAGDVVEGLNRLDLARRLNPELRFAIWEQVRYHELLGERDKANAMVDAARDTATSPRETLLNVARLASWRGNDSAPAGIRAELESWSPRDGQEREVKWFIRTLLDLHFGGKNSNSLFRPFIDMLIASAQQPGSPRRGVFCYQLIAEACVRRSDNEGGLLAIESMARLGLGETTWLRRCPLIDPLRKESRFRAVERAAHDHAETLLAEIGSGR